MVSDLYKKNNYRKDIIYIVGESIIEYDISSAGFNICKEFKLLDQNTLSKMECLNKHNRQVYLGNLCRISKNLSVQISEGFLNARRLLFENNNLQDKDILAIKKDAVWIINKKCDNTKFGYIEFIPKNKYRFYILLDKNEFYFNDNSFACKGIDDSLLKFHKDYMIDSIKDFLTYLNENKNICIDYLLQFAYSYRNRLLDINYYRELNKQSLFKPIKNINIMNTNFGYKDFNLDTKYLDISYNYINYIIPMWKLII